jgi:hypothetical protein
VMEARLSNTGDLEAGVVGTSLAWSERIFADLRQGVEALEYAPLLGHGIGIGTNVGAVLFQGRLGYLLAEGEWGRIVLEMGPLLGFLYLAVRVGILIGLFRSSATAARNGNILPLLLFGSCSWLIFNGQYGQATTVGFAVLTAGLCLASQNGDTPMSQQLAASGQKNLIRSRSKYAEFLYGNSATSNR